MHDALAAAAAVCPQCLVCHDYFVDVECQGEYTAGHTMVDRRGRTGKKPNVSVAMELDLPVFKQWLKDCLRPVSYTHLDVYKRQVILLPAWSIKDRMIALSLVFFQ